MKKTIVILMILLNVIPVYAQPAYGPRVYGPPQPHQQNNRWEVDAHNNTAKLAYDAIKRGDYPKAITFLTSLLVRSQSIYYYYNRAVCYDAIGKYKEAADDYNKALAIDEWPELYYGIGLINLKMEKLAEAIPFFNKAVTADNALIRNKETTPDRMRFAEKNKADAFIYLGSIYKSTGDNEKGKNSFGEAISQYSGLLKLNPRDEYFLSQRALCFAEIDQPQDAVQDYSYILSLQGNSAVSASATYYLRAKQYAIMEKYLEAIADFKTFLKADPKNAPALFYLASCKFQLDQFVEACTDYANSIKNGFKDSDDYKQIIADDPKSLEKFSYCK